MMIMMCRYKQLLEPAERFGRRKGLYTGLGNGFNWVLTYSLNAIGLTYGTRLVLQDLDKPADEKKYLVGVVFSVSKQSCLAVCALLFILFIINDISFTILAKHKHIFDV